MNEPKAATSKEGAPIAAPKVETLNVDQAPATENTPVQEPSPAPSLQADPTPQIYESETITPTIEPVITSPPYTPVVPYLRRSKEKQMIEHPWAEKGLIKIEKSGAYRYKTTESPIDAAFSLRVGMFDPVNLENPDVDIAFADIYDPSSGPLILGDYELRFLKSFGKMALKLGGGLFVTSGKGVFEENPSQQALESFSFFAVPLTVSLIYRMQFWEKQPFVPYAEGGGLGIPFVELRDDGASPKIGASYGAYFAGGLQIDLGLFGAEEMLDLDREYGINRAWLQVEFRSQFNLGKYDFSGNIINAGFLFEY
jgi:hypothetical protein